MHRVTNKQPSTPKIIPLRSILFVGKCDLNKLNCIFCFCFVLQNDFDRSKGIDIFWFVVTYLPFSTKRKGHNWESSISSNLARSLCTKIKNWEEINDNFPSAPNVIHSSVGTDCTLKIVGFFVCLFIIFIKSERW